MRAAPDTQEQSKAKKINHLLTKKARALLRDANLPYYL